MTILCREDAYLKSCKVVVTLHTEGGFMTDKTPFYPQGGGQLGDCGFVRWPGGEACITNAVKGEGEESVLHLTEGALPPIGCEVTLEIDWPRRYAMMRLHSCMHLLCAVVGAGVTGGQISPDKGRLDFDLEQSPDKEALTQRLNQLIEADHPITVGSITASALDAQPELVKTMSVQPPRSASGSVRTVRIGEVDYQPCGGTHVRSTAEIGPVRVSKIEKKGKHNRRISVVFVG